MSVRNNIKPPFDLVERRLAALKLIEQEALEQAEKVYHKLSVYDPYDVEVLYQFAKSFAAFNKEKALDYLTRAYDIEPSILDSAKKEQAIASKLDSKELHAIISNEMSRMWNVMEFNQIEPEVIQYMVQLPFRKDKVEEVLDVYYALQDRVFDFFRWKDWLKEEEPEDHFFVESNSDRTYVRYGQLFLAFKKLSPYLEDVRFLMSSEAVNFIDEIVVEDGAFHAYRHQLKSYYWRDKVEALEKFAKQDSGDTHLRTFLGHEYCEDAAYSIDEIRRAGQDSRTRKKYMKEVEKYLAKSHGFHVNNPQYFYERGRLRLFKGENEHAKEDFLHTVQLNNDHFDAHHELSKLAFESQKFAESLIHLDHAHRIKPDYIDIYFERGLTHLNLHESKLAEKDFKTCIKKVQSHHASSLLKYAYRLAEEKCFEEAEWFYKAVFRKNKQYAAELEEREEKSDGSSAGFYTNLLNNTKRQDGDAYVGLAFISGDFRQDYQKSIAYCDKAIKLNDRSFYAWYNKGHALQKLGKLNEAEVCYNRAIELDEKDTRPLHNKSMIHLERKDYETSVKLANKVLKLRPDHLDSIATKGSALFYLKRYRSAVKVYQKAIKYHPESDVGYHGVGLCLSWLKEDEQASEYNRTAAEINPSNYYVMSNLGNNLSNLGRYEEALDVLDRTMAIAPDYYHSYYVKACVYALTDREDEAIEMILETLKRDPTQKENLRKEKDFKVINQSKKFKELFE